MLCDNGFGRTRSESQRVAPPGSTAATAVAEAALTR